MVKQMSQVQDHNGLEADDKEIQGLEMKGGLASNINYPANYHHAPKSMFPTKYPKKDMEVPVNSHCMKITMGR